MSKYIEPTAVILAMLLDALGLTEREFGVEHEAKFLLSPARWLRDLLISRGWTPPPGK